MSFVHTYNFSTLATDAVIAQEIGRICKYCIELKVELAKKFNTIALQEVEMSVVRPIIGLYHLNEGLRVKAVSLLVITAVTLLGVFLQT
jgi:hypothetical protein